MVVGFWVKNLGRTGKADIGGNMSQFLSVSEVAQLLRVSTKWLYQCLGSGQLPGSFRIRGVWFIDREVLLTSLKEKAQKPKPQRKETGGTKSRHDL
jgi:predicted DNA-binding transcriptional regulator AlpA